MDGLTLLGLFAVSAMRVFYALEHRSRWFVLAFAGRACFGGFGKSTSLISVSLVRPRGAFQAPRSMNDAI